jgi:hypothetical protein
MSRDAETRALIERLDAGAPSLRQIEDSAQAAREKDLGLISNPFWYSENEAAHLLWAKAYRGTTLTEPEGEDTRTKGSENPSEEENPSEKSPSEEDYSEEDPSEEDYSEEEGSGEESASSEERPGGDSFSRAGQTRSLFET